MNSTFYLLCLIFGTQFCMPSKKLLNCNAKKKRPKKEKNWMENSETISIASVSVITIEGLAFSFGSASFARLFMLHLLNKCGEYSFWNEAIAWWKMATTTKETHERKNYRKMCCVFCGGCVLMLCFNSNSKHRKVSLKLYNMVVNETWFILVNSCIC